MSRHAFLLHAVPNSDVAEAQVPIAALIRSGLRRAFPLPAEGEDNDETFRLLLAALARRHFGHRRSSTAFVGSRS